MTDTTNALRALEAEAMWLRSLAASARARMAKLRPDMLDAVAARMEAAIATAQPEAKPEGVDDLRDAAVSLLLGARPYGDSTSIVPNARLKTLAQAARITRQAQGGGEDGR